MRIALRWSFLIFSSILISSCSLTDKDDDPDELGGSANIPMNEIGNTVSAGSLTIGDSSISVDADVTVLKNDSGEITAQIEIDLQSLKQIDGYQTLVGAIPARYKDSLGNISAELRFKSTSDGILDYANVDVKPHILVRYDDPVGTKYTITKSSGRTLTREVVAKSTTDDFPYGFMLIKVSTVEMQVNSGGVRKVTYRANHKFGIVHVEATLDDGSKAALYVYSAAS